MFILAICGILITQCLGNIHQQRTGQEDYFSELHSLDLTKPGSTFTFNFEQLRADQEPLIEEREEDMGKYLHTHPKTTTTTTTTTSAAPDVYLKSEEAKEEFSVNPVVFVEPTVQTTQNPTSTLVPQSKNWNNWQSAYPAIMPPAPIMPVWKDLNDIYHLKHRHQNPTESIYVAQHRPHGHHHHQHQHQSTSTTSESPLEMAFSENSQPKMDFSENSTQKISRSRVHHAHSSNHIDHIAPVVQPAVREMKHDRHIPHRLHTNRGSHKFSMDNVGKAPVEPIVEPTTVQPNLPQKASSPPPVPTLSPWYDGFGK